MLVCYNASVALIMWLVLSSLCLRDMCFLHTFLYMCWQTRKRHIRYNVHTVSKGRSAIGIVFDLFEVHYTLHLLPLRFFNQHKYRNALGIKVKITVFHLYPDLISVIHLL